MPSPALSASPGAQGPLNRSSSRTESSSSLARFSPKQQKKYNKKSVILSEVSRDFIARGEVEGSAFVLPLSGSLQDNKKYNKKSVILSEDSRGFIARAKSKDLLLSLPLLLAIPRLQPWVSHRNPPNSSHIRHNLS
jgi:hypothetical protein